MTVDTEKYLEFVHGVTSPPSLDFAIMQTRLAELEANGVNTTQLMTAALGLTAEAVSSQKLLRRLSSKANLTMMRMYFI